MIYNELDVNQIIVVEAPVSWNFLNFHLQWSFNLMRVLKFIIFIQHKVLFFQLICSSSTELQMAVIPQTSSCSSRALSQGVSQPEHTSTPSLVPNFEVIAKYLPAAKHDWEALNESYPNKQYKKQLNNVCIYCSSR